jgi:hypothetical protein
MKCGRCSQQFEEMTLMDELMTLFSVLNNNIELG